MMVRRSANNIFRACPWKKSTLKNKSTSTDKPAKKFEINSNLLEEHLVGRIARPKLSVSRVLEEEMNFVETHI